MPGLTNAQVRFAKSPQANGSPKVEQLRIPVRSVSCPPLLLRSETRLTGQDPTAKLHSHMTKGNLSGKDVTCVA